MHCPLKPFFNTAVFLCLYLQAPDHFLCPRLGKYSNSMHIRLTSSVYRPQLTYSRTYGVTSFRKTEGKIVQRLQLWHREPSSRKLCNTSFLSVQSIQISFEVNLSIRTRTFIFCPPFKRPKFQILARFNSQSTMIHLELPALLLYLPPQQRQTVHPVPLFYK